MLFRRDECLPRQTLRPRRTALNHRKLSAYAPGKSRLRCLRPSGQTASKALFSRSKNYYKPGMRVNVWFMTDNSAKAYIGDLDAREKEEFITALILILVGLYAGWLVLMGKNTWRVS